jgi:hypothetical protein
MKTIYMLNYYTLLKKEQKIKINDSKKGTDFYSSFNEFTLTLFWVKVDYLIYDDIELYVLFTYFEFVRFVQ